MKVSPGHSCGGKQSRRVVNLVILLSLASVLTVSKKSRSLMIGRSYEPCSDLPFREKPVAVIHIGPRKTATSSLQHTLSQNATTSLLKKDSYVFLGKMTENDGMVKEQTTMTSAIRKCFGYTNRAKSLDDKVCQDIVEELRQHRARGENVIISDEAYTRMIREEKGRRMLQKAFSGWEVHVVITYRRYYDLLLSEFSEEHRKAARRVPFVEWYDALMNNQTSIGAERFVPVDWTFVEGWQPFVHSVNVLNMYEGSVVERFICEMMPGAVETCKAVKTGLLPQDKKRTREDSSLALARFISLKAASAHLIKMRQVKNVTEEVSEFITKSILYHDGDLASVLPIECLSAQEKQDILNKSLQIESELLPDFYASAKGEPLIRAGFEEALEKYRFCSVDMDRLLQDDWWASFFHQKAIENLQSYIQ